VVAAAVAQAALNRELVAKFVFGFRDKVYK
jgi:hypothetical protein